MKNIFIAFCLIQTILFSKEECVLEDKTKDVNKELVYLRENLEKKYNKAIDCYNKKQNSEELFALVGDIQEIKSEIKNIEESHRKSCSLSNEDLEEGYAFWDQGETTLSKLIMEYGSSDYLYIIPPEISSIKISLYSSISIPHSSWNDMLSLVLEQNGIGIKKLTPFIRKLYVLKHDLLSVEAIVSKLEDLKHLPNSARVFYIFSEEVDRINDIRAFFERFSDSKRTNIQISGNKVIIISSKQDVERLIRLHEAIWDKEYDRVVKIINLTKIDASSAEKVVKKYFSAESPKRRSPFFKSSVENISIFPLPDNMSVVLIGEKKMVEKAASIIDNLENQLEDPGEKTIFWYTCKHSDPEELANILSQVYSSVASCNLTNIPEPKKTKTVKNKKKSGYNPVLPVTPKLVQPGRIKAAKKDTNRENFIVDPKTGSILIVVQKEFLGKIKSLLKKLDVPKKMAQIDVLLVERKLQDRKQTGINILKIGQSNNSKKTIFSFDASAKAAVRGILDFVFSKPKDSMPSIDMALSFLMAQEDLKVNANPSILAINQTPATISIVEELSINNGAIQLDTSTGVTVEKSYTRAQFGITIVMTPTIHLPSEDSIDKKGYISLLTDITFDTTQASQNDRPSVTRRHLESEVRIADGETIILGGLRRKSEEDIREKLPFLGDIPGIGKLFGSTKLTESSTEMFIFITPRIIKDPIEDLKRERTNFLKQRPGDIPEFLQKIEESKKNQKTKLFTNSMKVLFD